MIPKTIRVIGKEYTVALRTKEQQPNELGLCDDEQQEIKVRSDLSPETLLDTLIHECLHAIDYGMKLSMSERQVHGMATGIFALLRDNPSLLTLIQCLTTSKPNDSSDNTEPRSAPSATKSKRRRPVKSKS